MICRNGRIFWEISTLPVDNKRIIWDGVTILHNDIQIFADFLVVVTLSDDAVLVLVNSWEGVTMPDDVIRVNPGSKVKKVVKQEKLALRKENRTKQANSQLR